MKQIIRLTLLVSFVVKGIATLIIMVAFLVQGVAACPVDDQPFLRDGQDGNFSPYPVLETTPMPVPSREPIQVIASRISSNPLSGLEILDSGKPDASVVAGTRGERP